MGKKVEPIKDEDLELDLLDYLKVNDERIYIFYLILRYTGFRASDILPCRVADIQGNKLKIREQKTKNRAGKKTREILLHRDLKRELDTYIKNKDKWEVLFPNNRGKNEYISYTQAYRILKKASDEVGIRDFGTHSGRKTCAYHMYMKTKNLKYVQLFLMHDSKRDTIKYVGIEEEVRDDLVMDMDSPLSKVR